MKVRLQNILSGKITEYNNVRRLSVSYNIIFIYSESIENELVRFSKKDYLVVAHDD